MYVITHTKVAVITLVAVVGCFDAGESGGGAGETVSDDLEQGSESQTAAESMADDATTSDTDPTSEVVELPETPVLSLSIAPIKQFDLTWEGVVGADYYQLFESTKEGEPFVQVGQDLLGQATSLSVPLHFRAHASYKLAACNGGGCTESEAVQVLGTLAEAIGYFKAANTDAEDFFGASVALSADGRTLAVGAHGEDSHAMGNQADNSVSFAGAVYMFERDGQGQWSQSAFIKAPNAGVDDFFGHSIALSADGRTLAVGAYGEDSSAVGIDADQADNSAPYAGAVYVFERDGQGQWIEAAYIKASNTNASDYFSCSVTLSGNGNVLAVGSYGEDSNAVGIIGANQADNSAESAGAVYIFERDGRGHWGQAAYVKASNTDAGDQFGLKVRLSGDGSTLAVKAHGEDSNAVGIIGANQADNSALNAGAVYVFGRDGQGQWTQSAYIKASNTGAEDSFGESLALSENGSTLAVGAHGEDSNAVGIIGADQADNSALNAGAVYMFERDGQGQWMQSAYIKASNTDGCDMFGGNIALSGDASTLAVGVAWDQVCAGDDSNAVGIDGNQSDNSAQYSGAVYVFERGSQNLWSQAAYVKASNTNMDDFFGVSVVLSADGSTLAVGGAVEGSSAVGIGANQTDNSAPGAGAVYLY